MWKKEVERKAEKDEKTRKEFRKRWNCYVFSIHILIRTVFHKI